jgi:hypothetical protein
MPVIHYDGMTIVAESPHSYGRNGDIDGKTSLPAVHVHEPGGDPDDEAGHVREHGFDPEIEASHVRAHQAGSETHSSHDHAHMPHSNGDAGHSHEHTADSGTSGSDGEISNV